MRALFSTDGAANIIRYCKRTNRRFSILAARAFAGQIADLLYGQATLVVLPAPPDAPRWTGLPQVDFHIVCDADDEAKRLAQLRADFPEAVFLGLGEDILPAIAARADPLAPACAPGAAPCKALTVVFSTPRSGSSHLADVLTEIGCGACREHVQGAVAEALAEPYTFNITQAIRRFLFLCAASQPAQGGNVATKLILRHVTQWLEQKPDPRLVIEALRDVPVDIVFTDRKDRVAQAVSGTLASLSGVWQNRTPTDAAQIATLSEQDYDFAKIFWRYQSYIRDGHLIRFLERSFPKALHLDFDDDLQRDRASLVASLGAAFGWKVGAASGDELANHVRKTSSPLSEVFAQRFREDLAKIGLLE